MRERGRFRTGIILGLLAGVMASFAAMPVFIQNTSFLKGYIACLLFVLAVLLVKVILRRRTMINANAGDRIDQSYSRVLGILIIAFGLAIIGLLFFVINDWMKAQRTFRQNQLTAQSDLSESIQKTGLLYLMGNVLEQIDEDLKTLPGRKLSNETISRIASLSYSFEPYVQTDDGVSNKKYSSERGHLLLVLGSLNLDTNTLKKITFKTSFAGADLENASLNGYNLSGANLQGANLKNTDMHGTILNGANLSYANLWGAKMRFSKLQGADLRRADLSWSDLSYSNLWNANLNGVNLSSALIQNAILKEALIQWAYLTGTVLKNSDLSKADFFGTTLEKAQLNGSNFTNANFTQAYLIDANFTDAIIKGADFSRSNVEDKDWMELLNKWNVTGREEIITQYNLSPLGKVYRLDKVNK